MKTLAIVCGAMFATLLAVKFVELFKLLREIYK